MTTEPDHLDYTGGFITETGVPNGNKCTTILSNTVLNMTTA